VVIVAPVPTVASGGYLISYQKVLTYTTHIKKIIAELFSLVRYTTIGEKFCRDQKFRLTPVSFLETSLDLSDYGLDCIGAN